MDLLNKHEEQQGNGLSYELWKNFPVVESLALRDLNVGYGVYPDLVSFNTTSGGAATYTDSSSTIAQLTEAQGGVGGGIRVFNTADNEEASIQWCGGAGSPFRISNVAGEERELVFECRFRTDVITDAKAGFFIGLAEEGLAAANTITDAGALADKDAIGFHRLEGDGDTLDFVYQKAGQTAQTVKADWKTIAASTPRTKRFARILALATALLQCVLMIPTSSPVRTLMPLLSLIRKVWHLLFRAKMRTPTITTWTLALLPVVKLLLRQRS